MRLWKAEGTAFVVYLTFAIHDTYSFLLACMFQGQWRTLHYGLRTDTHDLWANTIMTCCILHNITIDFCGQGWSLDDDFGDGVRADIAAAQRRNGGVHSFDEDPLTGVVPRPPSVPDDAGAKIWRDSLLTYLQSLGHL